MNRIVRRRYPIDQLPKDLRVGLPEQGWVRIEINTDRNVDATPVLNLAGRGQNVHGDVASILSAIEAVRQDR